MCAALWSSHGKVVEPALQVNVRAGQLPPADDNGIAYLRIPLNALKRH